MSTPSLLATTDAFSALTGTTRPHLWRLAVADLISQRYGLTSLTLVPETYNGAGDLAVPDPLGLLRAKLWADPECFSGAH